MIDPHRNGRWSRALRLGVKNYEKFRRALNRLDQHTSTSKAGGRATHPGELRIFIDKSIVGGFVNGRQCVVLRVYPGRADSRGVSLRVHGKNAVLGKLDAWQMKSIFPSKEDETDSGLFSTRWF